MDDVTYFKLPPKCFYVTDGGDRIQIKSFAMRETDGADEEIAAKRAEGDGGKVSLMEHLIMMALTEVNVKPVNVKGAIYQTFMRWNSRARLFAAKAYSQMNSITKEESDAFLGGASGNPVPEDE